MNKKLPLLLIAFLCINLTDAQTYIQNVNIVDVVHQKIIPAQTVMISNSIITSIKPGKKMKIPQGANIINGEGKFLLPGMTDSHVHFFQSGGLYTRPDALDLRKQVPYDKEIAWTQSHMEEMLLRYLKSGITTVIDPGATYHFLSLRDSFKNKKNLPTVYMSGPLITTYEPEVFKNLGKNEPFKLVSTVEDAKKLVQEQLPYHPDCIKIWYIVFGEGKNKEEQAKKLEPVIKAAIDEAHKNNLKVAVHATERFTAQIAVQNGANFLVHDIEDEVVSDDFVKLLKSRNVIVSPTLTVMDNYYSTFGQHKNYTTYELENSNPKTIGSIDDLKHLSHSDDSVMIRRLKAQVTSPKVIDHVNTTNEIRRINLKKLMDGGVTIAAGTDAGNIGTQHATSLIEELKAMKASGLTNWQVLQSATINPTKIFNTENSLGSITEGKTADLVLLRSNPVENLDHLTEIDMVFKNGRAIPADSILKTTAEMLVQQQVNGYNARNIDAFLEPYGEDVELYTFPDTLLSKGKETMRKTYTNMFSTLTDLHCEIKERIINGNFVIDKEIVSGLDRPGKMEATAIYEIKNDKISKVYFLP
ncbi:amidohydrolase family protein [Chryseobacterium soli]|uniref:amidohydrolase family protein n=1 Tax=Chryseobacterium soli TaxID=445961 RepID=UPI0029531184|nr:amidohydrolase family protein [Chryseobacterium soli]MDV7698189.1 amidohydrolase family protein [Chryseobacterium soli]